MRLQGKVTTALSLNGKISKTAEVMGPNVEPISIYENGAYYASNGVDGFNPIYVDTPEPKEEQEKTVDITGNGTTEVLPDENKVLGKVTVNVDVAGGTEEIETIIDNSGVLDSTEGSVSEKVEQLIDKAEELDFFMHIINANQLFQKAHSFPTKATVNLPNATGARETFAHWITEPIPTVEEITVNAPNLTEPYAMFMQNWGVEKVTLNLSDKCQKMTHTFTYAKNVKEIVLDFPTQNITGYYQTFYFCGALERIVGVLDFSSTTGVNSTFHLCGNLKEVTFAPNTLSISISLAQSSKLTADSVQSIIDGLATVETAQTLTLNSAITLTDEQKATINAKGWTLAQ